MFLRYLQEYREEVEQLSEGYRKVNVGSQMRKDMTKLHEERGASMVEYAILVALLSLFVLAGMRAMGNNFNQAFSATTEAIKE